MAADVLSSGNHEEWAAESGNFDFQNGSSYLLQDKLTAGSAIFIEGTLQKKCTGFTINLKSVEDIIFHLNPRFDQRYIARNSKIHKKWGLEESQMLQPIPLKPDQTFFLEILVSPTEFWTSVNGFHLFTFSHRVPYQDIKSIEISPHVNISKFVISHPVIYPSKPQKPLSLPIAREHRCPVYCELERLQLGDVIQVIARVDSLPNMFYINLQAGLHYVPHPIVSYHLTARYLPSWNVVQNSWSNGKWNEEVSEKLPSVLLPGETVHITIRCQQNGYSTSISGKQLKTFPYRVPVTDCNALVAEGDIKIISIKTSAQSHLASES